MFFDFKVNYIVSSATEVACFFPGCLLTSDGVQQQQCPEVRKVKKLLSILCSKTSIYTICSAGSDVVHPTAVRMRYQEADREPFLGHTTGASAQQDERFTVPPVAGLQNQEIVSVGEVGRIPFTGVVASCCAKSPELQGGPSRGVENGC